MGVREVGVREVSEEWGLRSWDKSSVKGIGMREVSEEWG